LELAEVLSRLYPGKIAVQSDRNLIGNSGVIRALATGADAEPAADAGIPSFLELRRKYLLYR
jgi:hypothetical protein